MTYICILFAILLVGCNSLPYKSDAGFLNSAQANSNEALVMVNGSVCKDMDGRPGACLKQVSSEEDIVILLHARPYSYKLDVRCSTPLGISFPVSVPKDDSFDFTISKEVMEPFLSFTCKGEIFPDDRDQQISMSWHLRIVIYDAKYRKREVMYKTERSGKKYLVLGSHAKYAYVCDDKGCKDYKKKTIVRIHGEPVAWSESEVMRLNTYGL
jgi:hypothetical protein